MALRFITPPCAWFPGIGARSGGELGFFDLDLLTVLASDRSTTVARHVWRAAPKGFGRYIVLSGAQMGSIPGISSARVQLLDDLPTMVGDSSFQTGWRLYLEEATFEYSAEVGSYLIVLHTTPVIGRNSSKEYFSIGGDRLRLVRIEDEKGHAVQNEYIFPNAEIGLVPGAKTTREWVELLESTDTTDVLSALVFLGGRHRASPERPFLNEPKESRYARLFRELTDNTRIQELIRHSKMFDNEWIKQAAALPVRGSRDRPF